MANTRRGWQVSHAKVAASGDISYIRHRNCNMKLSAGELLLQYLQKNTFITLNQWYISLDQCGIWLTDPYGLDCAILDASIASCDYLLERVLRAEDGVPDY